MTRKECRANHEPHSQLQDSPEMERAVLWREYQFGKSAYATTLVFRGTDGLVVVSPASFPDTGRR